MPLSPTDSVAVLDALTPEPGYRCDLALLSSYSVDLVAAAATMEALAGEGADHETMRGASLARACETLRDRVRIVCQAGRVTVPSKSSAGTLVLADRWIREVQRDGNVGCWHPKLALVRYTQSDGDDVVWRLWLGSRNLTTDTSWDTAVVAVGRETGTPTLVDQQVADAGELVLTHAQLSPERATRFAQSLRTVTWRWPAELEHVYSAKLWHDPQTSPGFPTPSTDTEEVLAVGPFVDGTTARALSTGASPKHYRGLLSTRPTLEALAHLKHRVLHPDLHLYTLPQPDTEDTSDERTDDEQDQQVEVHRGLHAKMIATRTGGQHHLWLGSANLTQRGWDGRNAEMMVHAAISSDLYKSLRNDFVAVQDTVSFEDLHEPSAQDSVEKRLDMLRNRIAATWRTSQTSTETGIVLEQDEPPVRKADDATLRVRLVGQSGWHTWAADRAHVTLPRVPLQAQTELIALEIWLNEDRSTTMSWVARAPMHKPPSDARDRAVLARLMGPRAFLSWLRALLGEITGDSGDAWPPRRSHSTGSTAANARLFIDMPTLEAVLKSWATNPSSVLKVDAAMTRWCDELQQLDDASLEAADQQAKVQIMQLQRVWADIRQGLLLPTGAP